MGKVATTQKLTNDHFKYCQFIIDWSQSTYNVSSKSKWNIRLVGGTIISTSVGVPAQILIYACKPQYC